jgi:hypothetical protein
VKSWVIFNKGHFNNFNKLKKYHKKSSGTEFHRVSFIYYVNFHIGIILVLHPFTRIIREECFNFEIPAWKFSFRVGSMCAVVAANMNGRERLLGELRHVQCRSIADRLHVNSGTDVAWTCQVSTWVDQCSPPPTSPLSRPLKNLRTFRRNAIRSC